MRLCIAAGIKLVLPHTCSVRTPFEMGIARKSVPDYASSVYDVKQKIWSGKFITPLFNENMSIGQVALFVLGLNPHKVVQKCATTGEQLTSQNLAKLGKRVAQHLKLELGLQQEDIVGIMVSNTTYVRPVILGALLAGATLHPVHHSLDRNTVKNAYSLTKPKVVFCDVECYNELKLGLDDIGLNCKIFTLKGCIDGVSYIQELFQKTDADENFVQVLLSNFLILSSKPTHYRPEMLKNGGDQSAAIMCTSGTTGVPKGVRVSHKRLLGRFEYMFIESDDILLTFSTTYWITGLSSLVRTLTSGALQVITDKPFSPELLFDLIEKYKITTLLGPPIQASLLVQCPDIARRDLSSIRTFFCGGAPLSVTVSKRLSKYLNPNSLCEVYGLTEVGAINMNRWLLKKERSVGQMLPNTKAKILSDDGEPLGIGKVGEIRVWSRSKWNGYYENPEMTQLTMDNDGWTETGDLGYFDEDGFLYICGRQKDILRHRHFLITPIEIEEVIQKIPGVVEVCVFGIPHQFEEDMPTAAVIKSPEYTLTEEDICEKVAKCLPDTKHLRGGVYFLKELPRTPSGKVQRHKLLSIVEELNKIK